MVVEIVGGRWDGKVIEVQDHLREVQFALPVQAPFISNPGEPDEITMLRLSLPVVETAKGWRIYWDEKPR